MREPAHTPSVGYTSDMTRTIKAILEPAADGSLHLPLPPELRNGKVRVEATLEAVTQSGGDGDGADASAGTVLDALRELRASGEVRQLIPDPVAWQRELRKDRELPGRD